MPEVMEALTLEPLAGSTDHFVRDGLSVVSSLLSDGDASYTPGVSTRGNFGTRYQLHGF